MQEGGLYQQPKEARNSNYSMSVLLWVIDVKAEYVLKFLSLCQWVDKFGKQFQSYQERKGHKIPLKNSEPKGNNYKQ